MYNSGSNIDIVTLFHFLIHFLIHSNKPIFRNNVIPHKYNQRLNCPSIYIHTSTTKVMTAQVSMFIQVQPKSWPRKYLRSYKYNQSHDRPSIYVHTSTTNVIKFCANIYIRRFTLIQPVSSEQNNSHRWTNLKRFSPLKKHSLKCRLQDAHLLKLLITIIDILSIQRAIKCIECYKNSIKNVAEMSQMLQKCHRCHTNIIQCHKYFTEMSPKKSTKYNTCLVYNAFIMIIQTGRWWLIEIFLQRPH